MTRAGFWHRHLAPVAGAGCMVAVLSGCSPEKESGGTPVSHQAAVSDATAAAGKEAGGEREAAPEDPAWQKVAEGERQLRLENYPAAEAAFAEALVLEPTLIKAYEGRANAQGMQHKFDAGIAGLTEGLTHAPEDPDLYYLRGILKFQMDRDEEGIMDMTEAIRLRPNDGAAYCGRAAAYMKLQREDAARQDVEMALKLNHESAKILLQMLERGIGATGQPSGDR